MGTIMVYRYRPMRVCPTITTSRAIDGVSFMRWAGHYGRMRGGSTAKMAVFGAWLAFYFFWLVIWDIFGNIDREFCNA